MNTIIPACCYLQNADFVYARWRNLYQAWQATTYPQSCKLSVKTNFTPEEKEKLARIQAEIRAVADKLQLPKTIDFSVDIRSDSGNLGILDSVVTS